MVATAPPFTGGVDWRTVEPREQLLTRWLALACGQRPRAVRPLAAEITDLTGHADAGDHFRDVHDHVLRVAAARFDLADP